MTTESGILKETVTNASHILADKYRRIWQGDAVIKLAKEALGDGFVEYDRAYVRCPNCFNDIEHDDDCTIGKAIKAIDECLED